MTFWRARRTLSAAVLAALVALTSATVSLATAAVLNADQRAAVHQQMDRRATLVAEAVTSEARRYVDTLRMVAAAAGAVPTLTRAEFAALTSPLTRMRLAGATSIAFLVPATDAETPQVQALWRSRGATGLQLTPGGGREHFFSVFSTPLDGRSESRAGLDASVSAPATQALGEARRSGEVTISDPYELIIDARLPVAQRQRSFSLTAPVYGQPDARGAPTFTGWVLMGLRGHDFVSTALGRVAQGLVDVTLRAPGSDGTTPVVATQRATVAGRRDLTRDTTVAVANRYWQVRTSAVGGRLPGAGTLPMVVALAGTALSLLLAGLVYVLATGRARAMARMREATAIRSRIDLLSGVLERISDAVVVVDHDGEILLRNPAAVALFGDAEPACGADCWPAGFGIYAADGHTLFPGAELPVARALAGDSTDQVELVVRNPANPAGRVLSAAGRPLRLAGGRMGAVTAYHDITVRKAAEAALTSTAEQLRGAHDSLAAQKEHLTQILDAIDAAVVTCDAAGTIVHANRAFRLLTGTGQHPGAAGTVIPALRPLNPDGTPIEREDMALLRALRGEVTDRREVLLPCPDGTHAVGMLHARPLRAADGTITGAVSACYDITSLRDREADLRAFTGVVAHDLKAPLVAIGGHAEILGEDLAEGAPPDALLGSLDRIRGGVRRMQQLINDLLTYATARDAALQREPVPLQDLVAEVIAERTAHLRADTAPAGRPSLFPDIYTGPLPVIHADRVMVRQLVDNLIGNALKYTLPGRAALIDISSDSPSGAPGWVRVHIADRGIGIPTEEQSRVFDSFHRSAAHTSYTGTGLGLAICRRVVERHGGTIAVADNPGGGTRVVFTLPAAPEGGQRPAPDDRAAPPGPDPAGDLGPAWNGAIRLAAEHTGPDRTPDAGAGPDAPAAGRG